ncbi:MAG TPA: hypothetical protein VNX18_01415 [Bryobacteraceae bacterium]|jgi:hypothetical protein|nr:hypothetical protein [Bryobacteraceae bacterium]
MSHNRRPSDPEKFIRDIEANQKNILWPDWLMNGRRADELFFKGSPTATTVQRIGVFLLGVAYLVGALAFLNIAREKQSRLLELVAFGFLLLAMKVILNAFRRP